MAAQHTLTSSFFLVQFRPRPWRPPGRGTTPYPGSSGTSIVDTVLMYFFGALAVVVGLVAIAVAVVFIAVFISAALGKVRPLKTRIADATSDLLTHHARLIRGTCATLMIVLAAFSFVVVPQWAGAGSSLVTTLPQSIGFGLASGIVVAMIRAYFGRSIRLLEAGTGALLTTDYLRNFDRVTFLARVPMHMFAGLAAGTLHGLATMSYPQAFEFAVISSGGPPPPAWILWMVWLGWIAGAAAAGAVGGALLNGVVGSAALVTVANAAANIPAATVAAASNPVAPVSAAALGGAVKGASKGWAIAFVRAYVAPDFIEVQKTVKQVVGAYCRTLHYGPESPVEQRLRRYAFVVFTRGRRRDVLDDARSDANERRALMAFIDAHRDGLAAPLFAQDERIVASNHATQRALIRTAVRDGIWTGSIAGVLKCALEGLYFRARL